MNHRTWPTKSTVSPYSSFCPSKPHQSPPYNHRNNHHYYRRGYSALPYDLIKRIAATFTHGDLNAASSVCKSWNDALRPLREAMLLLRWGKRFKHGRAGVRANRQKALESFLKGAARGSSLAMVDAGIIYWEMGRRDEGLRFYRRAADLGDASGQCNLGIAYLQADFANDTEAIRWLRQSACAGHARAQYQLALCLHHGRGIERNLPEAAKWYLRAAERGYVRAMYNASLCFGSGDGFPQSHRQAKKWMKRAADHGHKKAQFEHGLHLFTEGETTLAVVYLELACRAGEVGASHVRDVILLQLSDASRDRAMQIADKWRALPSSRFT
ncbi:hypothetical protein RND81_02G240500 [Saponaria officinalis]|uniref:F-box domain-containing protein n=1 Tax=Saponaria officinalis TaxID=3572 RepID=A0AAW1MNQ9_SAPOF